MSGSGRDMLRVQHLPRLAVLPLIQETPRMAIFFAYSPGASR